MLPFVLCLCPTYGRQSCLQELMYCYLFQDYPADRRLLIISDDLGNISPGKHHLEATHVLSTSNRFPSITEKYQHLWLSGLELYHEISPTGGEPIVLIMEDDDLYAPWYISSHVAALQHAGHLNIQYSQPRFVASDGGGSINVEPSYGRFFASIGCWSGVLSSVGGFGKSRRADFDQDLMRRLRFGRIVDTLPFGVDHDRNRVPYFYRWQSSRSEHGSQFMTDPADTGWWDRATPKEKDPVRSLEPGLRKETQAYYDYLLTLAPVPPFPSSVSGTQA